MHFSLRNSIQTFKKFNPPCHQRELTSLSFYCVSTHDVAPFPFYFLSTYQIEKSHQRPDLIHYQDKLLTSLHIIISVKFLLKFKGVGWFFFQGKLRFSKTADLNEFPFTGLDIMFFLLQHTKYKPCLVISSLEFPFFIIQF